MIRSLKFIPKYFKRYRESKTEDEVPKDWKNHLISLYLIRNNDGICLFSHHFQLAAISQIENQLIGMGFSAISKMMREVVDKSAQLSLIDLGEKKVLIEHQPKILAVLITTFDLKHIRNKLREFAIYFERMFELQQRISLVTHVCPEDYALASELVSFIFNDHPSRVLEIVPLIFKSIRMDKGGGSQFSFNKKKENWFNSNAKVAEIHEKGM
ncbi:MAG: hypothetical protein EAX86_07240 [Candidatus Heimdallarchaeota archaeon]|nr:hypothetical protein [Candidatus Heimdallarchaeota archaeon]